MPDLKRLRQAVPVFRRLRPLERTSAGRWQIAPGWQPILLFALLLCIPFAPFFTDPWMEVFFFVALYTLLGLGLNVVVGFAGLLDLGYVAFFATGAYLLGILSSPASPYDIHANFWLVLPLSLVVGALIGILLGLPVLPLRGDYLAIVTLGFGEIIRILITQMDDVTAGSQGLSAITTPRIGAQRVNDYTSWYFFVLVAAFIVFFVTTRLRDARIGRAWEAIREDEDVASAMGINTVKYKLMAFAIGAAIASLGGVIYASFIGFINPSAFTLQISIDVLAVVIIGGMGSTRGVMAGAFILVGIPRLLQFQETADLLAHLEWLRAAINHLYDGIGAVSPWVPGDLPPANDWGRQIADKRFIIYGALLIAIMVLRPSGLFPSRRRQLEFEYTADEPVAVEGTVA